MKYCLSSRQNKKYLGLADEIYVESRDYRQISDLFIDFPNKRVILEITNEDFDNEEKMNIIAEYGKASEEFCCCIYNLQKAYWFIERGIKFYYGYPISTYYDMRGLIDLGVEYIKVVAPLTFDMETLSKCNMKFRMVPNVAYDAYVPRQSGICGQWVRPEDTIYYENGIEVFEFEDKNLDKERTLYDIYTSGVWNGNLNLLLTNLNVNADNRGLPDDIGEMRSKCRQRCMMTGSCHYCETSFLFEKTIRQNKNQIKEMIANQKEEN